MTETAVVHEIAGYTLPPNYVATRLVEGDKATYDVFIDATDGTGYAAGTIWVYVDGDVEVMPSGDADPAAAATVRRAVDYLRAWVALDATQHVAFGEDDG